MNKQELPLESPFKRLMDRYAHLNWALLDQAMVSGTNFLAGILLVRYLGIEQYGQFVLAWMMVQFFLSIQNALVVSPMFSVAPKTAVDERPQYYSATFMLQVILAVVIVAVCAAGAFLLPARYEPDWLNLSILWPLLVCVVLVQLQDYVRRNLFSRLMYRQAFFLDAIAYGAQIPLIFLVIRSHPSFQTAMMAIAGTMLTAIVLGARHLNLVAVPRDVMRSAAIRHWVSSKWLLGSAVLQWVSGNYFMVVAGALFGPAMVGGIRAAQNLVGLSHILFMGLENIIPGEASRRYQQSGSRAMASYLNKSTWLILLGTGLIAGFAAVFAKPLLTVVYGAPNPVSVMALIWFMPLYMIVAISLPLRAGLRTLERTRPLFMAYAVGAALSLATAHYCVARYEVNGAMAGMLIIEFVMTAILMASLAKQVRLHAQPSL